MFVGYCAMLCGLLTASQADATVRIHIDLSSQVMHVSGAGGNYDWRVSTARSGYVTPRGHYRPTVMKRMHYSRKYHMSPMPHSIFFNGGYAIHGTYSTGQLGRPASHGCIRLAPGNAARLYSMVKAEGAQITITGAPPRSGTSYARAHGKKTHYARRHRGVADSNALAYAPARRGAVAARAQQLINPVFLTPPWGESYD
jgi:hypothetical protein